MKYIFFLFMLALSSYNIMAQNNSNNPYDSVGIKHNEVLTDFLNEFSQKIVNSNKMSEQDLYNYICQKLNININQCDFVHLIRTAESFRAIKGKTLVEAGDYYKSRGLISATAAEYINNIDSYIEKYMDSNYAVLYDLLAQNENEIIANQRLTALEKQNLLMAFSIARFSTKFWKDLSQNITNYFGVHPDNKKPCCAALKKIGKEDVKGAVGGAVAGAIFGPGALVGAGAGAIGASAAEAVGQLWDWLFD